MGHKQYLAVGQSASKMLGLPRVSDKRPAIPDVDSRGHKHTYKMGHKQYLAVGQSASKMLGLPRVSGDKTELRLWNGSLSYSYWQKPGVVRLTKVYIFNVTNPTGFLENGEKPRLAEVGPFVYREDMEKVNIKFHDNDTITYQHNKILRFVPEMSTVTSFSPNMAGFIFNLFVSGLAISYRANAKPFVHVTAEQLVFGASEGSFFPPRSVTKSDLVYVYDKDICRTMPLQYREDVYKDGIQTGLYTAPSSTFECADVNKDNKCFCGGEKVAPIASQLLTYSMIFFGLLTLYVVFVRAYKSFVIGQNSMEIVEIGRETLKRGSTIILHGSQRLIPCRDTSYHMLTPQTSVDSGTVRCELSQSLGDVKGFVKADLGLESESLISSDNAFIASERRCSLGFRLPHF
ncbi:hypothetical protein MSG28_015493 [Choristoneura fumiferana]|uniref:Uncharacterized protein n=1 Tax=Choristoneura fumiferana TaxID=7141 RepID=A0ACC0KAH7_CHOFU|nr:hypothetical protein MSG28_015493 [Choristoneura fumiferana]